MNGAGTNVIPRDGSLTEQGHAGVSVLSIYRQARYVSPTSTGVPSKPTILHPLHGFCSNPSFPLFRFGLLLLVSIQYIYLSIYQSEIWIEVSLPLSGRIWMPFLLAHPLLPEHRKRLYLDEDDVDTSKIHQFIETSLLAETTIMSFSFTLLPLANKPPPIVSLAGMPWVHWKPTRLRYSTIPTIRSNQLLAGRI